MAGLETQSEYAKDQLLSISLAFGILTTTSLLLRLGTRGLIVRRLGLDDLCILLATSCFFANFVIIRQAIMPIYEVFHGNVHVLARAAQLSKSSVLLYVLTMTLMKMSLGSFFLHLFPGQRAYRIVIYTVTIFSTLLGLTYFTIGASTCGTTAYFFPNRHCEIYPVYRRLARAWGVYNTCTVLIFPVLSIRAIWSATLSRKTKLFVCWLLCFATVGCVASFLRLTILIRGGSASSFTKSVQSALWTQIEAGVGVTCVNVACLRPLVQSVKKWFAVRRRKNVLPPLLRLDETRLPISTSGTSGTSLKVWRDLDSCFVKPEIQLQFHDWRDDRITPDEEIQVPPQALLQDFTDTNWFSKYKKDIVTHVREVDSTES